MLRKELLRRKVYYFGVINDLKIALSKYPICKYRNIRVKRDLEKTNSYIYKKPRALYIADLNNLPLEFRQKKEYKYIFTIIDDFSKLINCYLLKDIESNSINDCVQEFINVYGKPEEFGFNNGKEYLMFQIENFLAWNFIKMNCDTPYSTNIIKKINYALIDELINKYLDDKKNFDIDIVLPFIVEKLNKSVNKIIKHKPHDVFNSQDKDLHFEISENIYDYYQKSKTESVEFDPNEKCLLLPNYIKSETTIKNGYYTLTKNLLISNSANSKPKRINRICVIIRQILGKGNYLIEMPKTYKEANFMKDDMCVVNNKIVRKIEEDLWNKLVEYDPEDIEEENIIKEKNEEIIESDDDEGNCIADDEASFISKNIEVEDESNFDKKNEEINDKDDNTINNSMAV